MSKLHQQIPVFVILHENKTGNLCDLPHCGPTLPEACLLMVREHTSYVPSGTTQAFITGLSLGSGFQSSQEVSKSSANLKQKSE